MALHYFLIAYRNLLKHLSVSVATILGYALNVLIFTPVVLLIDQQRQFDNHHHEVVYRKNTKLEKEALEFANTPAPLYETLSNSLAGAKSVHFILPAELTFKNDSSDMQLMLSGAFVDDFFFDVFNFYKQLFEKNG